MIFEYCLIAALHQAVREEAILVRTSHPCRDSRSRPPPGCRGSRARARRGPPGPAPAAFAARTPRAQAQASVASATRERSRTRSSLGRRRPSAATASSGTPARGPASSTAGQGPVQPTKVGNMRPRPRPRPFARRPKLQPRSPSHRWDPVCNAVENKNRDILLSVPQHIIFDGYDPWEYACVTPTST